MGVTGWERWDIENYANDEDFSSFAMWKNKSPRKLFMGWRIKDYK